MPQGLMKVARNSLREALTTLTPKNDQILKAEYVSEFTGFFDVENVLIYNVGTSAFSRFTNVGLHVLRTYSMPSLTQSGQSFHHLYRYSLEPLPKIPINKPVISFPLSELNSSTKPHEVWWAMSSGKAESISSIHGNFGLHIQVPSLSTNFANVVKPLLDGVISGMHPGRNIEEIAINRLASRTGWPMTEVRRHLENPPLPILTPRRILSAYRSFVKWDPQDELCVEFIIVRSNDDGACRVWLI